MKSQIHDNVMNLVTETFADAYAYLFELTHDYKQTDLNRDVQYVKLRCKHEGIAFLTKSLPRLGEWFDKKLCGQTVERVVGFEPYDGLFPCFLRPFWRFIFISGEFEWNQQTADMVRCLRTIFFGLKKLEVPYDEDDKRKKLDSFREIEDELASQPYVYPSAVMQRAQRLIEIFSSRYNPECRFPNHGPGAVAGGEQGMEKWTWSTFYSSVHKEWPYWDYLYGVKSYIGGLADTFPLSEGGVPGSVIPKRIYRHQLAGLAREWKTMERKDEPTARLLLVPKDSRGPRVISCEPKELMYLQQGVSKHLMNFIGRSRLTKGHVNFDDQSINAALALESSRSKTFATIDLSDASDRVSCKLISFLFPERVTRKWFALRSTATKLPDGSMINLQKFAPMGSALCFPVEALVFWAIAVASVWEQTRSRTALGLVYVMGDDIIVPSEWQAHVTFALESVGLKVNKDKSFGGDCPFRESCGTEAYEGFDVTPFRVKKQPPQRPTDGRAISAWVKYAENSQYICPCRSKACLKVVEELLGPIPRVPAPQPFLSLVTNQRCWTLDDFRGPKRWSVPLSYWLTRLYVLKTRSRKQPMNPFKRIQYDLTNRIDSDPTVVVDRQSTLISKQWVTITYLGADAV